MKKTIKGFIGKAVVSGLKNPVIRASINQEGYVCMPVHMQVIKGADKFEDISKYEPFGRLAKQAIDDGSSCLGYDRLYTIWQALNLSSAGHMINTAEVGVYKGGTSRFICQVGNHIIGQKHKTNSWSVHIGGWAHQHYCFDTFEGHDSDDIKTFETHKPKQFDDTSMDSVSKLLFGFDCKICKGRFQRTSNVLDDIRLNMVHLDVDLYEPTVYALDYFAERMTPDGVIVVDDYGNTSCPGVKKAVDEFGSSEKGFIFFHSITGQAILFKR